MTHRHFGTFSVSFSETLRDAPPRVFWVWGHLIVILPLVQQEQLDIPPLCDSGGTVNHRTVPHPPRRSTLSSSIGKIWSVDPEVRGCGFGAAGTLLPKRRACGRMNLTQKEWEEGATEAESWPHHVSL